MIGAKLKMVRKNCNVTLKELAKRSGLSVSYLSNVERDATSPTLEHLQLICTALEVDFLSLLQETRPFQPVVRKQDRKRIYTDSYRTSYEMISDPYQKMKASVLTMDSGYYYEEFSYGHSADELDIILEGTLIMTIMDQEYILNEGDAIYIQANQPHKFRKISEGRCSLYCIKVN